MEKDVNVIDKAFDDLTDSILKPIQKKNYVIILLDSSGSMDVIRKEARDVFNEQVAEIRKKSKDIKTYITFRTFGTVPNSPIFLNQPVEYLRNLDQITQNKF